MTINWHDVYPAMTKQFNADESINFAATLKMIDELINKGVHGILTKFNLD